MQMFYVLNIGKSNGACGSIPEFAALYRKTHTIQSDMKRMALYRKMARILEMNTVMMPKYAKYVDILMHPRVVGFEKLPDLPEKSRWRYLPL